MKKNLGSLDKTLRLIVAIFIATLYFTGAISGTVALVLAAIGIISLMTSLMGFCPLYMILGVNSCASKGSCCGNKESCDKDKNKDNGSLT